MSIPRRKIEEIKVRYELEPTLRDVYLEGTLDKEIIDAALRSSAEVFAPTYAIDDIEVDAKILAKFGLSSGNRQRVIALARELGLPLETSVRLVVDRDFEDWLPTLPQASGLVKTKYCDVETVFFHNAFLKQVMLDASRCKIENWDSFFDAMTWCVRELFCLRLVIAASQIDSGLVDFRRCLKLVKCVPVLDVHDLIERSLSQCCNKDDRIALLDCFEKRMSQLREAPYQMVSRGHDVITIVGWSIRESNGLKSFQNEEAITRLLILFAENERDNLIHPIAQ